MGICCVLKLLFPLSPFTKSSQNICKILYSERCPGDLEVSFLNRFHLFNFTYHQDETMKLFYDMTFELGDLFVTILTFTNYFYVGCPVMPLAVNIHERKFKSRYIFDSGCKKYCSTKESRTMQRRLHCTACILCKIIKSCSLAQ